MIRFAVIFIASLWRDTSNENDAMLRNVECFLTISNLSHVMAQASNKCFKCGGKAAYAQSDGKAICKSCYKCDKCGIFGDALVKKGGASSVFGDDMKVCSDCKMQMLQSGQFGVVAPQQQAAAASSTKTQLCSKCKTQKPITGKWAKTKSGARICAECNVCDRCGCSMFGKQHGMIDGQKWCAQCINQRSASKGDVVTTAMPKGISQAKARQFTMTKLKQAQGVNALHKTNLGKERKCSKCGGKIAGPSVTVEKESGRYEYHRQCLFCDDCGKNMKAFEFKIFKDKQLCRGCVTKYLDFNHKKPLPKMVKK